METKILYNVTVKVLIDKSEDWMAWMREEHIPDVMATGKFENFRLTEIIEDDEQGRTFAIQYVSKDMETFNSYQAEHAKTLQEKHQVRYKDQYVAFRTLMNIIHEG